MLSCRAVAMTSVASQRLPGCRRHSCPEPHARSGTLYLHPCGNMGSDTSPNWLASVGPRRLGQRRQAGRAGTVVIALRHLGEQRPYPRRIQGHVWVIQNALEFLELSSVIIVGHADSPRDVAFVIRSVGLRYGNRTSIARRGASARDPRPTTHRRSTWGGSSADDWIRVSSWLLSTVDARPCRSWTISRRSCCCSPKRCNTQSSGRALACAPGS